MNLLAKLRNGRPLRKSRGGLTVILIALLVGAFLFWFYGAAAYLCLNNRFSNAWFCIIYTAIFAFLMASAFSQLGTLLIILNDTAFEFLMILFSSTKIPTISPNFSLKDFLLLSLQEFLVIAFTMLFSYRALAVSNELMRRTVNDKKYLASVSANFVLFLTFLILFVIICFTAF